MKQMPSNAAWRLKERAEQVAARTEDGQSAAKIAWELDLSIRTVRRYRARGEGWKA